ncbi:MAG: family 20 glycosylhydrolase [Clostridia bacterium]|nr:family 20 glycosylhydrolase [Clostridia bacterium]
MDKSIYYVNERIFMLDCGRKYYTPKWIKKLCDEIYAVGYTTLSIHFAEEMGLRLESKQYPFLAGGDHSLCIWGKANGEPENDDKYITQEEMADIVKYAQSIGLKVMPSFDSPGHMNYAVKKYNQYFNKDISNYFHKNGKVAIVQGSSVNREVEQLSFSRGIDIANPDAVEFAQNLYREYGEFFYNLGCDAFDIGGDELLGWGESIDDTLSKWNNLDHWQELAIKRTGNKNAVAHDAFILYINDICKILRSIGYKNLHMWNDDVYRSYDTGWTGITELDKDLIIQYWAPFANNGQNTALYYLEKGHKLYNFTNKYTYYVLGKGFNSGYTVEQIDKEWNAYVFDGNEPKNNPVAPDNRVLGGGFCLWSDTPNAETEDELLENMRPYFTVCAKKLST